MAERIWVWGVIPWDQPLEDWEEEPKMSHRTWMMWGIIALAVVGIAIGVRAAGQAPPEPMESSSDASNHTISGLITSVDLRSRQVQVTTLDGAVTTVQLNPHTLIVQQGERISTDRLHVGQSVTVQETEHSGTSIADAIQVLPSTGPKPQATTIAPPTSPSPAQVPTPSVELPVTRQPESSPSGQTMTVAPSAPTQPSAAGGSSAHETGFNSESAAPGQ